MNKRIEEMVDTIINTIENKINEKYTIDPEWGSRSTMESILFKNGYHDEAEQDEAISIATEMFEKMLNDAEINGDAYEDYKNECMIDLMY